jgi:hypothetical protein
MRGQGDRAKSKHAGRGMKVVRSTFPARVTNLGWTQEFQEDDSLRIITELAMSHAVKGGEQGLVIGYFIATGDYNSLCDYDLDYDRCSPSEAYECRQALAYFSKYKGIDLAVDREQAARKKFVESEEACRQTNDIFKRRARGEFYFLPRVESIISMAQQKIARVLGDVPGLADLRLRFGPGATTLTKKRNASIVEKLGVGISCSEDLLHYAASLLGEMPHWAELHSGGPYSLLDDRSERVLTTLVVTNDRLDFVPKNARTHRSITIPPSLNGVIQLGYGDYMSARLKRFGVDLKDQSINQRLALEGSLRGTYATLDLKSASDTISTEVVFDLLPVEWALALNAARASLVDDGDQVIRLEKFSSMGNGFTFPLQSLIFWALCSSAASDGFASVYGDDIIVSTDSVNSVLEILTVFGFTLNKEKSYWAGPFRESCGADYYSGIDIRPVYQKNVLTQAELFRLHNFYARKHNDQMRLAVKAYINPELCLYGPDGFGDGHLLGDWSRRPHKRAATDGYGGVLFDTFKLVGRRDKRPLRRGDRVLPLYSIYTCEGDDDVLAEVECGLPEAERLIANSFLRIWSRNRNVPFVEWHVPKSHVNKGLSGKRGIGSDPIPEGDSESLGVIVKHDSLPVTDGYKRVSIYTFDSGR